MATSFHSSQKILDAPALRRKLALWRFKQERVVFTNGCFDLLHLGHVDYLEAARALGSRLIVGLNADASVARLKPGRPLQAQDARARLLAAMWFVDAVVVFEEETPAALIEAVRPDVLVKGDDYALGQIVGADFVQSYGGEVRTLALVPGHSTSAIVARIRGEG